MSTLLHALHLSVFKPRALADNQSACNFVLRYSWALIVARWHAVLVN